MQFPLVAPPAPYPQGVLTIMSPSRPCAVTPSTRRQNQPIGLIRQLPLGSRQLPAKQIKDAPQAKRRKEYRDDPSDLKRPFLVLHAVHKHPDAKCQPQQRDGHYHHIWTSEIKQGGNHRNSTFNRRFFLINHLSSFHNTTIRRS